MIDVQNEIKKVLDDVKTCFVGKQGVNTFIYENILINKLCEMKNADIIRDFDVSVERQDACNKTHVNIRVVPTMSINYVNFNIAFTDEYMNSELQTSERKNNKFSIIDEYIKI